MHDAWSRHFVGPPQWRTRRASWAHAVALSVAEAVLPIEEGLPQRAIRAESSISSPFDATRCAPSFPARKPSAFPAPNSRDRLRADLAQSSLPPIYFAHCPFLLPRFHSAAYKGSVNLGAHLPADAVDLWSKEARGTREAAGMRGHHQGYRTLIAQHAGAARATGLRPPALVNPRQNSAAHKAFCQ